MNEVDPDLDPRPRGTTQSVPKEMVQEGSGANRRIKKRPSFGIRTVELNRSQQGFGFTISGQCPCVLSSVVEESPAKKAGLKPGDSLVRGDGNVRKRGIKMTSPFFSLFRSPSTGSTSPRAVTRRWSKQWETQQGYSSCRSHKTTAPPLLHQRKMKKRNRVHKMRQGPGHTSVVPGTSFRKGQTARGSSSRTTRITSHRGQV